MDGTLVLRGMQRRKLLEWYRRHPDPQVRLRAHIILLLADGRTWALIGVFLYCSSKTIALWKDRFEQGGVEALLGQERGRPATLRGRWAATAVGWVRHRWPGDFGLSRSRWCCRAVVVLMLGVHGVSVSEETVRRWLRSDGLVWRRPRPALSPRDPQRDTKLAAIRSLLAGLPADQTAVFCDEVDINTNPKLGCAWMQRGEQALVLTPGTNVKREVIGGLSWRTGHLVTSVGAERQGRDTDLFLSHLDDLRRAHRRYRVIHVIADNARNHKGPRVDKYLAACDGRIQLHYLPTYSPDADPIERVWWKLHEAITRNHRCKSMDELLALVMAWLSENDPYQIEDQVYFPEEKAA
jgi:putative transposase